MRRGLHPDDLGDLFDQPLSALVSLPRADGTVLSRPVWHRFVDGRFAFQCPAGDRKIALLQADPRLTILLAENAFPYRAIEVRGRAHLTSEAYHERGADICRRYVEAYDPSTDVAAYLSQDPGAVVEILAETTTCWDYADDFRTPPRAGATV